MSDFKRDVRKRFNIHVWDTDALARSFARADMSLFEKLFYLCAFLIVSALTWVEYFQHPLKEEFSGLLLDLGWQVAGLSILYVKNRKIDGFDFVWRIAAFSFANVLRIAIFTVIYFLSVSLMIALMRHYSVQFSLDPLAKSIISIIVMAPYHIVWIGLVMANLNKVEKYQKLEGT